MHGDLGIEEKLGPEQWIRRSSRSPRVTCSRTRSTIFAPWSLVAVSKSCARASACTRPLKLATNSRWFLACRNDWLEIACIIAKRVFHSMVEFIDQQPLQFFGALALRDVAGNLRRPDDCAPFVVKRRNGEGYVEPAAVFRNTNRFVVLDALASSEPRKNLPLLLVQFRRNDARDRLSDHLARIKAEHAVRAGIP